MGAYDYIHGESPALSVGDWLHIGEGENGWRRITEIVSDFDQEPYYMQPYYTIGQEVPDELKALSIEEIVEQGLIQNTNSIWVYPTESPVVYQLPCTSPLLKSAWYKRLTEEEARTIIEIKRIAGYLIYGTDEQMYGNPAHKSWSWSAFTKDQFARINRELKAKGL
jgi:(2Fe-2S) ferredoxin